MPKGWRSDSRDGMVLPSKDKLISGLVLCARLFLVYIALIIFSGISTYVDLVLLPGRSIPIDKLLNYCAFEAAVEFVFVLLPIVYAMENRRHFLSYFAFVAAGMAVFNLIKVGMLALSGAYIRQHGLTFYNYGTPTVWGLLEIALSLIAISLLIAVCLKLSEQWMKPNA